MIFRPQRLPENLQDVFGDDHPLVMELGFGNGSFLIEQAKRHPDKNFLGAEKSLSSLTRAMRSLSRQPLDNVRLYPGDGRFVLDSVLPRKSLSHLWINFPDPWPRRRHRARRLLSSEFFGLVGDRLCDDATISLTTDHADYFAFARDEARHSGIFDERVTEPPEETLNTRYARKWAVQERSFFHVTFTLVKLADKHPPTVTLQEMQHAHLSGQPPQLSGFDKTVYSIETGKVVLLDAFAELDSDGLVFLVLVEESALKQEILVELTNKGEYYQVFVRQFGSPLPTKGVSAAMGIIVEWLVDRGMKLEGAWY